MKQQFLVGIADTIRLTIYDQNRPIVPSSATITLYNPDGSTLQASASVTAIDSTTGEMTYSLTATHTATGDLNYKAVWAYVSSGTTYYQTQLFDVVKTILAIPITDDDLYNELDSLRVTAHQASGTASSATTSTLLDTTNRKEDDNFWKGSKIKILAGTGVDQERIVTAFTQSTSTFTVTPNWTTTPSTDSVYSVVRSYYPKIEQSFVKLQQMIYDKGKRHQLILESSQITVPLIYLTVHHLCLDLMMEEGDKWNLLANSYWDKFNMSFNNLKLEYDEDDSGSIQGDEEQDAPTTFRIGRS